MSIPKEPRQIMINLMYLVLTALLALNVSNEILQAFRTLSSSIDGSNESIERKNKETYQAIVDNEGQAGQYAKVHPFRLKADEVVKRSDAMIAYFEDWKKKVVMEAGGYSKEDPKFPDRMDNIDATTLLLVEKKGGDEMKKKIEDLRAFMLSKVTNPNMIAPLMPLKVEPAKKNDHNPTGDWSIANFEHMPAVAALALFSKFENDVRSSEALVVKALFDEAHVKDIKFDTIGAVALPQQTYVLEGDKVEAQILLAAFNKAQKPEIKGMSGGGSTKPAVNGVIPWETIAHGTGMQTVRGRIELQTETGPVSREWKFEYMVGTTGASMQLDKMNVFYIGVANPVTVAAAGYSVEDVSISVPGGDPRADSFGRKGHYNIWVDKPGTVEVAINAKKDNQIKKVGGMTVRVKRIPDPIAMLNKQKGGSMSAPIFRAQVAPEAVLEQFEFNAKFTIVSFQFSMQPKGKDYQGPFTVESRTGCRLQGPGANPQIEKLQNNAHPGDRIFIENIKAVGPDKTTRSLGSLVFTLTN
jgi:gliding motility-associated protein GldM